MLLVLLLLALLAGAPATDPARKTEPSTGWSRLGPGLELRRMDASPVCRKGSPEIVLVRADPGSWRLDLFHYTELSPADPGGTARPLDIEGWQEATRAPVIFNAGQYYPNRAPMGLFIKGDRNLGTPRVKAWKGLLVAEPHDTGVRPLVRILDLDYEPFDIPTSPYTRVAQSFMILDRQAKKRVRRSEWHANRTIVATDARDRLLVMHTRGAYTLWELADWIAGSDLDVREALSLDGGFEAQICIRAGDERFTGFGSWNVDDRGDHSLPGVRKLLPAAIGLFPREEPDQSPMRR